MEKRIIFQNDEGGVSVIVPNYAEGFTIDDAKLNVPTGKAYAIVDVSDVPTDRSQRSNWAVDETDLTDGIGE
ncbi:hypothetical protein [Agrobacterium rosae]|uniref:hypothetical protein n=1 Tax=Agrobacterium rosae TaxID=1972867 RepID=UPI0020336E73|nr:hypothetical protein [Agrobacterium rosae]MCM2433222.1 hypothetical protein [Agrobacterium rosae]